MLALLLTSVSPAQAKNSNQWLQTPAREVRFSPGEIKITYVDGEEAFFTGQQAVNLNAYLAALEFENASIAKLIKETSFGSLNRTAGCFLTTLRFGPEILLEGTTVKGYIKQVRQSCGHAESVEQSLNAVIARRVAQQANPSLPNISDELSEHIKPSHLD